LIFNASKLILTFDLQKNGNFLHDKRAGPRFGIHQLDFQATKVKFYNLNFEKFQDKIPHEYSGIQNLDPFLRKSLESALEFLRPFFFQLEQLYKTFAPELYETVLQDIENFKSRIFLKIFSIYKSGMTEANMECPFYLWTSCWLSLHCFTHAHTDSGLGDQGYSGTLTGGNMKNAPCFGVVDW
jgi:hypothetical protein